MPAMDELHLSMSLRLLFRNRVPGAMALALAFILGALTVLAYGSVRLSQMRRQYRKQCEIEPILILECPEPTRDHG